MPPRNTCFNCFNDCLFSIDCIDFQIAYSGKKFHSHKFKFGSALCYEVAVSILKR